MIAPPCLGGRDRYERVTEAWVDNTHEDAFTHTVRLTDPERSVEVSVVALPSPTYEIRESRCRALAGSLGPAVLSGFATLAGTRLAAGLTRRVAGAVGSGEGAPLVVAATVEVARLARQVAKLPRARAARAACGDPWECWQLDTTGWVDLPNSCFTYSDAGRALFGTRTIATAMTPDLYSPAPGQRRVFERRKVARLERTEGRLALFHSMHDNAHGFELRCEIELATGRIVRADHATPKLPYMGICSEPQAKIVALIGEVVDADFPRRLQALVGGPTGCAQLYDLTSDLLKLLAPRAT